MTDLITLLTFPSTSDGFTALHSSIHDNQTALPSLPLSKVARLDADSDPGSASRSRASATSRSVVVAGGPVRVVVSGGFRECGLYYPCELFIPNDRLRIPIHRATSHTTADRRDPFSPATLHAHHSYSRFNR